MKNTLQEEIAYYIDQIVLPDFQHFNKRWNYGDCETIASEIIDIVLYYLKEIEEEEYADLIEDILRG